MTDLEVAKLKHGLYLIYWKDRGGTSLASVGSMSDGKRWIAPTNWTSTDAPGGTGPASWSSDTWECVEVAVLLGEGLKEALVGREQRVWDMAYVAAFQELTESIHASRLTKDRASKERADATLSSWRRRKE